MSKTNQYHIYFLITQKASRAAKVQYLINSQHYYIPNILTQLYPDNLNEKVWDYTKLLLQGSKQVKGSKSKDCNKIEDKDTGINSAIDKINSENQDKINSAFKQTLSLKIKQSSIRLENPPISVLVIISTNPNIYSKPIEGMGWVDLEELTGMINRLSDREKELIVEYL